MRPALANATRIESLFSNYSRKPFDIRDIVFREALSARRRVACARGCSRFMAGTGTVLCDETLLVNTTLASLWFDTRLAGR